MRTVNSVDMSQGSWRDIYRKNLAVPNEYGGGEEAEVGRSKLLRVYVVEVLDGGPS